MTPDHLIQLIATAEAQHEHMWMMRERMHALLAELLRSNVCAPPETTAELQALLDRLYATSTRQTATMATVAGVLLASLELGPSSPGSAMTVH